MQQRNVGSSGLRVSAVGLGCNNFGWLMPADESVEIIHQALDLGVTLFDTAPVYGQQSGDSEQILGRALRGRRDDAVIVTKFGVPADPSNGFNTSRRAIMKEIEASLTRLGTDYVDVYMLHWPDPTTPMEETLRALDDIVTAGKARYLGCCNLPAWQVVQARWIAKSEGWPEFIVAQNEYSLAQRSGGPALLPALDAYGMGFMPYSPLANGLLSGKYGPGVSAPADSRLGRNTWNLAGRYLADDKLQLVAALTEFAQDRGHTLLELAFAWLLSNSTVCSVIAGATRSEQIEANVAAGSHWRLDVDDQIKLDDLLAAQV